MLSRSKKARGSNDLELSKRSQMYLDSSEAKSKQYKILSAVGLISLILILVLYKVGLFSRKSDYIVGSSTQRFEEGTNKILSAWGQAGEALKFANLPSSGQGYLTVSALVVQEGIYYILSYPYHVI